LVKKQLTLMGELDRRSATTAAWIALVVVEQINAESGIGYRMSLARSYGQTEIILVGLVVYAFLGVSSDTAVRLLSRADFLARSTR
jgi:sulfonate transport system permease protein